MGPLLFFFIDLILSASIAWYFFNSTEQSKTADTLLPVIFGICITNIAKRVKDGWPYLRILSKLTALTLLGKPLRISFATLIKIKCDNKYLLVKSKRTNLFQPPGGVLRFYDKEIKNRFSLVDDKSYQKIPDDEFRMRFLPGQLWKIFSFLKWFDSRRGRELDPHREFYEELIDTNILDSKIFSKPQFSYLRRVIPPISFGEHFQIDELFLFEIFELVLSDKQRVFISNLQKKNPVSEYFFMTAEDIERRGFNGTTTTAIGAHTRHII